MSKELEALKELTMWATNPYRSLDEGSAEQKELVDCVEKALKALEIIKEKEVNVFIFLHSGDLETYNDMVEDNRKLTEQEYDLLKEKEL